MKRALLSTTVGIFIVFSLISCDKKQSEGSNISETEPVGVYVGPTEGGSKSAFNGIWDRIEIRVGHDRSECNGKCYMNKVHADCMGVGSACKVRTSLNLSIRGDNIFCATTVDAEELTTLEFFQMPDRSVRVDRYGTLYWMNIPAQLVERDQTTGQFSFNNVSFTFLQNYPNE